MSTTDQSFTLPPGSNPWGLRPRPGENPPIITDEQITQAIGFVSLVYQQGNKWTTKQYQRVFDESIPKQYRRDLLDMMKCVCHSSILNILERIRA